MSSLKQLAKIKPARILVISQRFLGDTLLLTPLLHSLRTAYPTAKLDVLVSSGNFGILEGNPDIDRRLAFPQKSTVFQTLKFSASLFKRYDLSIACQASDRTIFYAITSGKSSLGFIEKDLKKSWWKKLFLTDYLTDRGLHTVLENLRFCDLLNVRPITTVIPPQASSVSVLVQSSPYAVLHVSPQWRYKQWTTEGWLNVISHLHAKGYHIILSGSQLASEKNLIEEICTRSEASITNIAGKVSLAQLSVIIKQAILYIGPDTGITHLAAATGCPTIAIFGPTNPEIWSPWPNGYQRDLKPYSAVGSQNISNIYLIQNPINSGCIPCQSEGCDKHRESFSQCLLTLDPIEVNRTIDTILN